MNLTINSQFSRNALILRLQFQNKITTCLKQGADFIDKGSPCVVSESSKKVKSSPHGQVSETSLEELQEIPNSVNEKLVSLDLIFFGFPTSDGVAQDFMGNCEVGLAFDDEFVTTKTAKTLDDKKKGEGEVGFSRVQKLMLLEFCRPPPTNILSQCSQVLRPRCLCHLQKSPDCSLHLLLRMPEISMFFPSEFS